MIKFENINVSFQSKILLENFNLEIYPQDKVLIKGRSGIGKSTILKLLLGFVKADNGQIYFKDDELIKNIWHIRKNFAYVPQDLDIFAGNTLNLFAEIAAFKGNNGLDFSKDTIIKYFDIFLLEKDILQKNYEDLSGGEKQRIAVIVALLLNKSIFLLDEITSALDKESAEAIIKYFCNLSSATQIIISHDESLWLQNGEFKVITL
ncbi:MAG: ATP-binding cassette domain-containing protein [Pseudomonadota bacterium]